MAIAPTRTDAALVRRLQARDRTAWEELYAEYQPRLRAFGYRLRATPTTRTTWSRRPSSRRCPRSTASTPTAST